MTPGTGAAPDRPIALGLRPNAAQFILLVAVNALVGGMLGQERTVLPLLATRTFHLGAYTAALTYILVFGVARRATVHIQNPIRVGGRSEPQPAPSHSRM